LYAIAHWLYKKHVPFLPMLFKGFIRIAFAAVIPYQASIGKGTRFGYQGLGIVIHKNSVIGCNCRINQGVTIGGTSHKPQLPIIGDNVILSSGCKIIGSVVIGDNCVIGTNAVVVKNIPARSVAVGVPAKVIKEDIDINQYL
jgi:serine O-acetyltransferase